MKIIDIILAILCTETVVFLLGDILKLPLYLTILAYLLFPILSVVFLFAMYLIGKKAILAFQAGKHVMIGGLATVVDLKMFEVLLALALRNILLAKSISFVISTSLKYIGNKHWAFERHGNEGIKKEMVQFLAITVIGLSIDLAVFYYSTKILGPQFAVPPSIWVKTSVILAAVAAAVWNFLGYKLLVFKK
ncbi:GtrA family protein [Candidatus Parcubacteria bacterium]|nr:GtrA family protein [Candidatus Parcubacteria bacterium]